MADEDPKHLKRVRGLTCCAPVGVTRCSGPIEAHHYPYGRGTSQKTHDHTAVPLCKTHHTEFHQSAGPFKHMGKAGKKAWSDDQVDRHQRLLGLVT